MEYLRMLTVIIIVLTHLIVPGKAEFTVQPVSVERAKGLEAVFRCQYQPKEFVIGFTVTYDWFVNDVVVQTYTETVRTRRPSSPGGPATLTILATTQHNNSVVQCEAKIRIGTVIIRTELSTTATLTVHATAITNVLTTPKTITVMWKALPRTGYCVHITKTTLDSTEIVVFDFVCGLANEYIFMYSNPISVCDRFSFTVTPTGRERRGRTSGPVTGFFTRAEGSIKEPHRIRESGENKSVGFNAIIPSCTRFTRYRVDSDFLTTSISHLITDPLLFDGSLSFSLPTDKMTEYSVTLTDENRIDLVFENIKISTFDVQDLLVSGCPGGDGICVSIEYVEGTVSPGALVCAVRIINGVFDFGNIKLVTIAQNSSENFPIPVPSGEYRLIAFDLESNQLPRMPISMVALSQSKITVHSDGENISSPLSGEGISATKLSNGDVNVTCSNSALNCLVLLQSTTTVLDEVIVGFINASSTSTFLSLNDTFGGYVVVYSWNSLESIFEGQVSLIISELDLPISAPTTPPTSDPQTDPPPHDMESQPTSVIAATIVVLVVIITLVIVLTIVVVLCLVKKVKRGGKVLHSSNSEGSFSVDVGASITSQVAFHNVACPEHMSQEYNTADTDDTSPPGYDVACIENMPSPEYETVPSAAGKPTFTSENPPPLPHPMIKENEGLDNDVVLTEETTSTAQAKDEPTEDGGDSGGYEAKIAAQHQYMLVEHKPSDKVIMKDSSKVIYSEVDKDKLKPVVPTPVAKTQGQYTLVETKPASSAAKVMDSTKVVYVQVDKDKLKPVDPNDPPALPPQRPVTNTEELNTEKTLVAKTQGQYILVETKPASSAAAKVMDSTKVVYVQVDKDKLKPVNLNDPPALPPRRPVTNTEELHTEKTLALPPRQRPLPPPPTHETLMDLLHPVENKWEDIGEVLNIDEDRVDEIFTNNENDYLRLHKLMKYYFMNVHCSHSWEEMVRVLTEIGEHGLAGKIKAEKIQGVFGTR